MRIVIRFIFAIILLVPLFIIATFIFAPLEWIMSGKTDISPSWMFRSIGSFILRYEVDDINL